MASFDESLVRMTNGAIRARPPPCINHPSLFLNKIELYKLIFTGSPADNQLYAYNKQRRKENQLYADNHLYELFRNTSDDVMSLTPLKAAGK